MTTPADHEGSPTARSRPAGSGAAPVHVSLLDDHPRARAVIVGGAALVLLVAGIGALVTIVAFLRPVLAPMAVAVLLAGLLLPLQVLLNHRLRLPRMLAAFTTVFTALGAVFAMMYAAGQQLADGVSDVRQVAAFELSEIKDWVARSPLPVGRDQVDEVLRAATGWVSDNGSSLAQGALGAGQSAVSMLFSTVLCLIMTIFMLAQGDRIAAWVIGLFPGTWRPRLYEASRRGWVTLGTYTKMQLVISGVDAVGIGIGAAILGVPFVLPIVAITFVLCFIPVVGAVVAGAIAVLVALAFQGFTTALLMLVVVVLVQQAEGNLLSPVLMGRAVDLHPLAVLLTVTSGSFALGLLGALIAVPIVATVNTMAKYLAGRDPFPLLDASGSALTDPPKKLVGEVTPPRLPRRLGQATPPWLAHERDRAVEAAQRTTDEADQDRPAVPEART